MSAGFRGGRQKNLALGIRKRDATLVPSLTHKVAGRGNLPLSANQLITDAAIIGYSRNMLVNSSRANGSSDIGTEDQDLIVLEFNFDSLGELSDSDLVKRIDPIFEDQPSHGSVHGTSVQIAKAELVCEFTGRGAFAGPGRSIDCDDHRLPIKLQSDQFMFMILKNDLVVFDRQSLKRLASEVE